MKFRFLTIVAAAIMAISAFSVSAANANERYGKQKVVYHINFAGGEEGKVYAGALKNIQNHINAVGAENLDLKVVIHGNGIALMQSAKQTGNLQTAVANLKSQDVSFQICANTLESKKISQDALYEVFDEDIVPSGVAELARLQGMGYAYIRP